MEGTMSRIATRSDELERQIEEARLRWVALQAQADAAHEEMADLVFKLESLPEEEGEP
jgi:hypothetical protein